MCESLLHCESECLLGNSNCRLEFFRIVALRIRHCKAKLCVSRGITSVYPMDSGEFATEIIIPDSERNGITLDYFRKEIVFMTAATNRKDQVLPYN